MKFKSDQTIQKLRGGYYTPQNLADYTTKWVLGCRPKKILEPSCGDGVFFQSLANNKFSKESEITGFELFNEEATKSRTLCEKLGFNNYAISQGDFLQWVEPLVKEKKQLFDGIIGNPPFVRYQFLEKPFQIYTESIFDHLKLKFTKHTNAWVPFIVSCISLLKSGGRLGMIIPSEIINVMHAQSLRSFLGIECSKIVIIDPKEIWFTDTLQGAVILLAEKKKKIENHSYGVSIKAVNGFDFLNTNPEDLFSNAKAINGETVKGKWTKAVLEPEELALINKVIENPFVHKFDDIAKVEVGIVTGANDFFLVDSATVKQYSLEKYVKPMFGRSQHCQGIIYDKTQHASNKKNGLPINFIYINEKFEELPKKAQDYIQLGESKGLNTRYKCRIRNPWYTVPSVFSRRLSMLKRSHNAPRLIFNELDVYTTDTAYRVESKNIDEKKLAYCFLNPLTAIFAEIEGRSYGGGVLEMVPSEIRRLYIPVPENFVFNIKKLDEDVKSKSMEEVLRIQGNHIFSHLGFNKQECNKLFDIWMKLKNRRHRKD